MLENKQRQIQRLIEEVSGIGRSQGVPLRSLAISSKLRTLKVLKCKKNRLKMRHVHICL